MIRHNSLAILFTTFISISYSQVLKYDTLNITTKKAPIILNHVNYFTDSILQGYYLKDSDFLNGTAKTGLQVMPKPYFDKFIGKYFSYTATNKVGLPDGNSISITPSTNSTRLQGNLAKKNNKSIYNAGLSTDLSDNISSVVSGKDVTANTTLYLNFSFLRRKHSMIEFDANEAYNNNQKKILQVRQFQNNLDLKYQVSYQEDWTVYQITRRKLDSILALPARVQSNDTVRFQIIKIKNELSAIMAKIKTYGLNEWNALYNINRLDSSIEQRLKDSLTTILDTLEINSNAWTRFRFSWFSGGITYNRQQYKTYDSLMEFNKRINDLPFNNTGLTFGFNYFSQRSQAEVAAFDGIESFYLSAAYSIRNDINYSHLDEKDLVTLNDVSSANTVYQFQKASKVRDISGLEKKTDWLHTFGLQTTVVVGKSSFMGINTGISASYGKLTMPIYNGKIGLLFRYISSEDQKSKLNFELFLELNDWNDSKESSLTTWQRKTIGFNITIPFNKLFF